MPVDEDEEMKSDIAHSEVGKKDDEYYDYYDDDNSTDLTDDEDDKPEDFKVWEYEK